VTLPRPWLAVLGGLLVLSLAANLFVAGIWLGRSWAVVEATSGPAATLPPRDAMARFVATLPPEARAPVTRAFGERRAELRERTRELREARREVLALIQAAELDTAALDTALGRLRAATTALQTVVHGAFVEAAPAIPADARAGWRPRALGGG
jgi:uncharacterized membrane protein